MKPNPYQKRAVSLREVIDRIEVGDPAKVSHIILLVAPCRSGTTPLLRVFEAAGIRSYFEKLKYVLRWRMQGGDTRWRVPQMPNEPVVVKETLGPYTETGASFNSLDALLGAGFPPEKLQVLIVGRAPLSTWASWDEYWRGKTAVDKLILAYKKTECIRQQAEHQRIPLTVYAYEAIRDNDAETVVKKLFERLGVPCSPIAVAVRGWRSLPPFGAPGSNIVLAERPSVFFTPHLHDRVEKADGLVFFSRKEDIPGLREDDVKEIAEAGLPDIYEGWRTACEENLHVKVKRDHHWDQLGKTVVGSR